MADFDPFNSNFDGTLSQVTVICRQMSSDDEDKDIMLQFVSYNINGSIESNQTKKSYNCQLKPNDNEAINWLTCEEEVDHFKKLIDGFVSKIKTKYKDVTGVRTDNQTFISSNLPIENPKNIMDCHRAYIPRTK